MPLVKQNVMKSLSEEDKEMIRREIRDGGEGVERGLRWKQREDREIERKETKGN